MAQSPLTEPGEQFCRDLKRLVETAGNGFPSVLIRRMPGTALDEALVYDAVPVTGFESAFVWQTGRPIGGGRPTASAYQAKSPSLAIMPINPTGIWVDRATRCLGQQPVVSDPLKGARFHRGETEISILFVETRDLPPIRIPLQPHAMGGPRLLLEVRNPPRCPKESRGLTAC